MDEESAPLAGRLRIVCKPSEEQGELELPLRMLFVGNFMGEDRRPIEDRVPVRFTRDSFSDVLAAHSPRLDLTVAGVRAQLVFKSLADFGPDSVGAQVPELARKLRLRDALTALKATGDVEAFRLLLPELVEDPAARARLVADLGLQP
jgi:type VI secretion system ImpB/VipA family protein